MPRDENTQLFKEVVKKLFSKYGSTLKKQNFSVILSEYRQRIENYTSEPYQPVYKQVMKDISQFMLPKEVGTIPIITVDDNGNWIAEYFVPHRKIKTGSQGRTEGWKHNYTNIVYRGRALDATNINKKLFKPGSIGDMFKVVNIGNGNTELNKQALAQLVHKNTGLGMVLLDNKNVAIVPYKYVADSLYQTFYSFEFETNMLGYSTRDVFLNNYEETLKREFMNQKGFNPPWREVTVKRHKPRAYVDYSVGGSYPIELVNTGFTLPTLLFFTHHWTDVITPYIAESWRENPPKSAGLHVSATVKSISDRLESAYLYGIRLLDTVLFRPGNRRKSTVYLSSMVGGRGFFRWNGNRLEIRYPQPRLDKKYLMNQFIISAKYVGDINLIHDISNAYYLSNYSSFPRNKLSLTKQTVREFKQYFDVYSDILGLSPSEKLIFKEHVKYCTA